MTSRGHGCVARDRLGSVAVQPGPAVAPAFCGGGAVGRPLGADLGGPLFLQGGAAVQTEQVSQGNMSPHLDRLPSPLRQQVTSDQPAHALALILHRDIRHIDAWPERSSRTANSHLDLILLKLAMSGVHRRASHR